MFMNILSASEDTIIELFLILCLLECYQKPIETIKHEKLKYEIIWRNLLICH